MPSPGDILNDVLLGQDGWMFLWQGGQRQFDHLMGEPPTRGSVEAFTDNLLSRQKICAARQIPFLHVVFPSKPVVMTEHLPEAMRDKVHSLFERHYRAPTVTAALGELCIYPDEMLRQASSKGQVYSRHDSHMTAFGDAVVSRALIRGLGWRHDPLHHMDTVERPRSGDLANMANIRERPIEVFLFPSSRTCQIWDNRLSLPSNTDNVVVAYNPFSISTKRLLALGDSFLANCLTSLSTFFRDILYVRSAQFQPELLDLFAPDAVVTGNAERYLRRVEPDAEAESVVMRCYGRTDYNPTPDFSAALRAQLAWKAYPKHYSQWSRQAGMLSFRGLGVGKPNGQLVIAGGEVGWLESTGRDPTIVFDDTALQKGIDYRLRVSLEAETQGVAQLFIGQGAGLNPFSEAFSIRIPVKTGQNLLDFEIAATGRSQKLRFDPLNCPGKLRIAEMELTTY